MEELGTPMDQIFNAEKPRHSADFISHYFSQFRGDADRRDVCSDKLMLTEK